MCTASWFFTDNSYHLFFNRDELRSRSIAHPPEPAIIGSRNTLLPIDPDGGGTWIGVNDRGWSFALLNFYQADPPSGELISRGGIVKGALAGSSAAELDHYLQTLPLDRYAPFSLLCFAPPYPPKAAVPAEQSHSRNSILMCRWDGETLQRSSQESVVTSSSRDYDAVVKARTECAARLRADGNTLARCNQHRQFHRSHADERSALSVCMHRSDARTVSYSEVSVRPNCAEFAYYPGSPCETRSAIQHEIRWE